MVERGSDVRHSTTTYITVELVKPDDHREGATMRIYRSDADRWHGELALPLSTEGDTPLGVAGQFRDRLNDLAAEISRRFPDLEKLGVGGSE